MNVKARAPVVLVTGCSSGIGRRIAILLARQEVRVLAGVRREADAVSLQSESDLIEPVILDVTDRESVDRVARDVRQRFPEGIDGLVNNAGIVVAGPLELVDVELWRDQYEVNVFGLVRLTQSLLPSLRRSGGRVINVGSASSNLALPMMGPYASSKSAVDLLSDALRRELSPCGIRVVVISPGQTATAIYSKSEEDAVRRLEIAEQPDGYDYRPRMRRFQQLMNQSASFRASPDRVAAKVARVLFVKHPRSRYHVGWDARLSVIVARFIPVWFVDWIIRGRFEPTEGESRRDADDTA